MHEVQVKVVKVVLRQMVVTHHSPKKPTEGEKGGR
jgi:hypothetical protein